jgi:hypothetical protein
MSARQSAEGVITGRGGIKLPEFEWDGQYDPPAQIRNFMHFFHQLWETNGIEFETEVEGHYNRDHKNLKPLEMIIRIWMTGVRPRVFL